MAEKWVANPGQYSESGLDLVMVKAEAMLRFGSILMSVTKKWMDVWRKVLFVKLVLENQTEEANEKEFNVDN